MRPAKVKVIFTCMWFVFSAAVAQEWVRPSPLAIASVRYKDTYVKITYSRPQKRGREIFGKLVPYGEVWRTGANEATELTTTRDLFINGQLLPAGTYSLFTIPRPDFWTVIINRDLGLWGAYNYNPRMDVLRFDVPVQSSETFVEPFTITFDQKNNTAELLIMWDLVKIILPIQFIEPKP